MFQRIGMAENKGIRAQYKQRTISGEDAMHGLPVIVIVGHGFLQTYRIDGPPTPQEAHLELETTTDRTHSTKPAVVLFSQNRDSM
jgi:hypothetical protein